MGDKLLRPSRLIVAGLLLAAGGGVFAVGCVIQQRRTSLAELSHITHKGVKPFVMMGKMVKKGVECVDCHEGAKTGDKAGMPPREFCMDCHEDRKDKDKFVLGGPLYDKDGKAKWTVAIGLPEGVKFSHARHTKNFECAECHGDVANDDYSLVDLATKFENCRRCHLEDERTGNCARCHSSYDKNSLPHSHDERWKRKHGAYVRNAGGMDMADRYCNSCHATSYCVKCHKEEKPRDHTAFWSRAGHGLAADIGRERCATCHLEDSCVSCHLDGTPARPAGHPSTSCELCHGNLRRHVVLTDNCLLCHR